MASAMADVLHQLQLGHLLSNFDREKISPDLVCKLNVLDFESLGVQSRNHMMAIRVACTTYGGQAPQRRLGENGGAPQFVIGRSLLENFLQEDFTIKEIASMLAVSERTVYRRMQSLGLSKLNFSEISDDDLDRQMEKLTKDFPYCGEKMLRELLREKGVHVQRMRLRDSLHRVDDVGVSSRRRGRR